MKNNKPSFLTNSSEIRSKLVFLCLYLVTHLAGLLSLPIFADEAIYIRWTQLIMDEPLRYLFFPLNDGKTPLYIWSLLPFQYIFFNQLLAARLVSVLVGLGQLWITDKLINKLGGGKIARILSAIFITFLPFWYFHHRMALMDGMLTFWLTAVVYLIVHVFSLLKLEKKNIITIFFVPQVFLTTVLAALALGAGLWTKLPAILLVPSLFPFIFLFTKNLDILTKKIAAILIVTAGAVIVFAVMKLHPAFGQLFSRGGDFLFPLKDVLIEGKWKETLPSAGNYLSYFTSYLSLGVVFSAVLGILFKHKYRATVLFLVLAALLFSAPIVLLGKVVYPRYLFPAALYITPAAALTLETLFEKWQEKKTKNLLHTAFLLIVGLSFFYTSTHFVLASIFYPDTTPFVPADKIQYLTEWSSGHGIAEISEQLQEKAKTKRIAVATEGFFGTLPDGMLLYLHQRPVTNITVEGIGQPVVSIPDSFLEKASRFDEVWLVVNSHRMKLKLPADKLKQEFCRPYDAPCLQLWDITEYVRENHSTDTQNP